MSWEMVKMQDLEQLRRELERQGKAEKLRALADSAEGQRVGKMVDPEKLSEAARTGDAAALREMLSRVLGTAEGRALAENVRKMMEK